METDGDTVAAMAVRYARERLGPLSVAVVRKPAVVRRLDESIAAGVRLEDAVLQQVFQEAKTHRGVANEFFGHFVFGVVGIAKGSLGPQLRRLIDTGDLLDSVMGSLWEDLRELHFDTRAQFVRLVAQALRWKAQEYDRRMRTLRRREDMQTQASPEDLQAPGQDRTPSELARSQEERRLLPEALARLPYKSRYVLERHLGGMSLEDIAVELGVSLGAAQKALERALEEARNLGWR